MKHKWHKEIKAWADGAEIEKRMLNDTWQIETRPDWYEHAVYRIKPQPKEPQYLYVWIEKSTDNPLFEFDKPNSILEDDYYKYIGKIKLEIEE